MAERDRGDLCRQLLLHYAQIIEDISRSVNCPHVSADLTQETYFRALRYLDARDPPRDIPKWLRAIGRNVIHDYFRLRTLRGLPLGSDELERVLELREGPANNPQALDIEPEQITEAVNRLPPLAKALIRGFYFEGKGCEALGIEFGIHRENVKVHLYRARKKLRDRLCGSKEGVP